MWTCRLIVKMSVRLSVAVIFDAVAWQPDPLLRWPLEDH
jgi:hypothetical protein